MTLSVGDKVPPFKIPVSEERFLSLDDFKGKKVVIYFYPKDNTPGCTVEAEDFRDHQKAFEAKRTAIIGISKDSLKKHKNFSDKLTLSFPLGSDEETQVCEDFGVWVEKSMYGKKYMGIERSTFLVNESGYIEKTWRKVKVKDHVKEVLEAL
jgi:thioredoxin-dependent peroxiredoxin